MTSPVFMPRQRGVMLLEALIAILIFSMGILAIVGMQAAAIRNTSDAKYRADASYLANRILGEMWADRFNLPSYAHYAGGASVCSPTGSASTNAKVTSWLNNVNAVLPGAPANRQQIVLGANNMITVRVCWRAPQDTGYHNFEVSSQING